MSDHQRHEPVAEPADQRRHGHEEHHDQAVTGHEHVERVRIGKVLQTRLLQFHAHGDGQDATHDAAGDRQYEIQRADVLVVGGKHETPPSMRMIVVGVAVSCSGGHESYPVFMRMN